MTRHALGQLGDYPNGTATPAEVAGTKVVVWRDGEQLCVVRDHCPHLGLSLTRGLGGMTAGDGEITCPWHGSRFDVCTGENRDWAVGFAGRRAPGWSQRMIALGRKPSPLTTYPVAVDGDQVFVEI